MSDLAIGIDLGTSTTCAGIILDGKPTLVANEKGELIHASVVSFLEDGRVTVGNPAKSRMVTHPATTIHSAKRFIGRYFFSEPVRKARDVVGYVIKEGSKKEAVIEIHDNLYAVPEISALVLKEMKRLAETTLGLTVTEAVITVPAYFNDNQRQATRDAGRIAGLKVLRIINEPTAAALAYGFGRGLEQRVAVYDLGGGTFDISVLEIGTDVFEVLATAGDTYLGGDDFDQRIINRLSDLFETEHNIDPRQNIHAHARLRSVAEAAKKTLSTQPQVEINIPDLVTDGDGAVYGVAYTLTAVEFSRMTLDLIQRSFQVCDEALRFAKMNARDLDGVILVGGPTRLPMIQQAVSHYFGKKPFSDVNPEQVVAIGAALQASALAVGGQSTMLLDVTPLSLKIEIASGLTATIIEKNTPVPIDQARTFTTTADYQEKVTIRVLQGESGKAAECTPLGEFGFAGFEKALRGQVQIEVTFEIDSNGIVNVSARDPATGKTASRTIQLSGGLSEEEILRSEERARDIALAPLEGA